MKNYIRLLYADTEVGVKLTLDANDGIKSMKDLKNQIREAKGDLVAMSEKFGESSEQARTAAKRVAELNDQLGDAKNLVDAFNPDRKFAALAQSLNGVLGGFSALQGAMGLLGVESENVQKQLLKVQSALALSQGLNQVGESINSFKNLGTTIVQTLGRNGLIGVAIAGVATLGAAISGLFKGNRDAAAANREYNKTLGESVKEVNQVKAALAQAERGVKSKDEALKIYNDTLGKTVGHAKNLEEAERLTAANADNYIKAQAEKAKANFLLQRSVELQTKSILMGLDLQENKYPAFIRRQIQAEISENDKRAKALEAQANDLAKSAESRSMNFNRLGGAGASIGGGLKGSGSAKTPGGQAKEFEANEIAKIDDDRLIRTQTVNERLAAMAENLNKNLKVSGKSMTDDFVKNQQAQIAAAESTAAAEDLLARQRIQTAKDTGAALGALSDLVGKQTAAGKVLAIAQATINTWVGVTEIIKTKSLLPEPLATISRIANITTVIASGINAVRNITKVQVPGYSATGGNTPAPVSAPITPEIPRSTSTRLDADQINQIGNATVRAFVVESDVTNNQERIRRLNRAARL